jgi:type II secretory pathway pseudopilin PulG
MRTTKNEAGFTLVDVLFTMAIIGTLSTIAMPGLLRARSQAGTASAMGTLRVINSGQLSYAITCGSGFYSPTLRILGTPAAGTTYAFIPSDLGAGGVIIKANYRIEMDGTSIPSAPPSCNGAGAGQGVVGYRSGATSQDGNFPVHYSSNTSGAIWTGSVPLFGTTGEAAGPPAGTLVK